MKRKSLDNDPAAATDGELGSKKRRLVDDEDASLKASKKAKKSKKERKLKTKKTDEDVDMEMETNDQKIEAEDDVKMSDASNLQDTESATKEAKFSKKDKSKKKKKKTTSTDTTDTQPAEEEASTAKDQAPEDPANTEPPPTQKKTRFIVFVGNLPYSATKEDIERHFQAVQPTEVRLLHHKNQGQQKKSRGVAFVEFGGYDHMKTCLKTMHHSVIKCHVYVKGAARVEERQINVELTAGGGGNTRARKDKILAKNFKLNEQRERRAAAVRQQARKEKLKNAGKEGQQKGEEGGDDAVHPSRRSRVLGGA